MDITKTQNGDTLTLSPNGTLNTANATAFEAELDAAMAETTKLILDFTKVDFVSSSGLRVLLKAQKKMSTMQLININASVKEVFELTGLVNILNIV